MEEKSKGWDQPQISALCKSLESKIPDLLDIFKLEYRKYDHKYTLPCPVHGGDNSNGCTIFENGAHNWACWTHGCQYKYKKSLLGFIRGVLSHRSGREVSISEAIKFCSDFLNCKIEDLQITPVSGNGSYVKMVEIFTMQPELDIATDRPEIHIMPSQYYKDRKYSENILLEFEIGDCLLDYGVMAKRAVVPYYDMHGNYLGSSGRVLSDKDSPKWINTKGLKKSQILYGLHVARQYIEDSGTVIIVEGPGDVWRLNEAGFKNSVAISGANLSDAQLLNLEMSGCLKVIILTDNDDAGKKAAQQIIKKCGRRFNYVQPEIPKQYKDIGEMTLEEIKTLLENI
jgi:5S rRNA maturation endonuclease (ribonuclease M5)